MASALLLLLRSGDDDGVGAAAVEEEYACRSHHIMHRVALSGLLALCQRSYSFVRQSARFIAQ